MPRNVLAEAADFYHGLLQGEVLERTHEQLLRGFAERRMTYKGRTVYRVLRPRFITPEQQEEFRRASSLVGRALETVYRRACLDEPFRRELLIQDWEELMMPVDAGTRIPLATGRLDGFVGPDGVLRFIEYNPAPGGPFYMDLAREVFAATPALEAFSRRYEVSFPQAGPSFLGALKSNHALAGRSGVPRIAFFGPTGPEDADEEILMRDYLEAQGLPLEIVTPEDDWAFQDGRLSVRGLPVDVVTFINPNALGSMILGCPPEHPLMQAFTAGAAYFMNGLFRCFVLRSKVLFAALSTLAHSEMFAPEVRAALVRHIPWTRIVREGKTRHGGQDVDLLPFIAEHRERLVLKPAYEYGGAGVLLGWQATAEAWSTAVKKALEEPWIIQERVPTPQETYPVYDGGQVRFEQLYTDLNPLLWNDDQQEGYFVRVTSNSLLNLATGGTLTSLAVIRERA